jgi:hypothetical protein
VRDRTQAALVAVRLGLIRVDNHAPPRRRALQVRQPTLNTGYG